MPRKQRHCYDYPRPALTADVVIFAIVEGDVRVLLIQRKEEPFKGRWAIPGGFVNEGETLEQAARRELQEETGVTGVRLEQLQSFGDPGRDPRGWVVTVAFMVLIDAREIKPRAADDAADVRWFSMAHLPRLAFDHDVILQAALGRAKKQWPTMGGRAGGSAGPPPKKRKQGATIGRRRSTG